MKAYLRLRRKRLRKVLSSKCACRSLSSQVGEGGPAWPHAPAERLDGGDSYGRDCPQTLRPELSLGDSQRACALCLLVWLARFSKPCSQRPSLRRPHAPGRGACFRVTGSWEALTANGNSSYEASTGTCRQNHDGSVRSSGGKDTQPLPQARRPHILGRAESSASALAGAGGSGRARPRAASRGSLPARWPRGARQLLLTAPQGPACCQEGLGAWPALCPCRQHARRWGRVLFLESAAGQGVERGAGVPVESWSREKCHWLQRGRELAVPRRGYSAACRSHQQWSGPAAGRP